MESSYLFTVALCRVSHTLVKRGQMWTDIQFLQSAFSLAHHSRILTTTFNKRHSALQSGLISILLWSKRYLVQRVSERIFFLEYSQDYQKHICCLNALRQSSRGQNRTEHLCESYYRHSWWLLRKCRAEEKKQNKSGLVKKRWTQCIWHTSDGLGVFFLCSFCDGHGCSHLH